MQEDLENARTGGGEREKGICIVPSNVGKFGKNEQLMGAGVRSAASVGEETGRVFLVPATQIVCGAERTSDKLWVS